MIRTTPLRRTTRQYSQIGFTLVRTFTPKHPLVVEWPFFAVEPRPLGAQLKSIMLIEVER